MMRYLLILLLLVGETTSRAATVLSNDNMLPRINGLPLVPADFTRLPTSPTPADADLIAIRHSGVTYKLTIEGLRLVIGGGGGVSDNWVASGLTDSTLPGTARPDSIWITNKFEMGIGSTAMIGLNGNSGGAYFFGSLTNSALQPNELVFADPDKKLGSISAGDSGMVLTSSGPGVPPSFRSLPPSGITTLNGLTDAAQTFSTGTAGSDFGILSSGGVHTFNLPTASAVNRGALSSSDWSIFNAKADVNPTSGVFPYNNGGIFADGPIVRQSSSNIYVPNIAIGTRTNWFTGPRPFIYGALTMGSGNGVGSTPYHNAIDLTGYTEDDNIAPTILYLLSVNKQGPDNLTDSPAQTFSWGAYVENDVNANALNMTGIETDGSVAIGADSNSRGGGSGIGLSAYSRGSPTNGIAIRAWSRSLRNGSTNLAIHAALEPNINNVQVGVFIEAYAPGNPGPPLENSMLTVDNRGTAYPMFIGRTSNGTKKFEVGSLGDLEFIKGVSYVWPSSQGGVSTFLQNDGSGNLSWAAAGSGGGTVGTMISSGSGAVGDIPEASDATGTNFIKSAAFKGSGSTNGSVIGNLSANFGTFTNGLKLPNATAGKPARIGADQTVTNGVIDVSSSDITGQLAATSFPALTGDVTTPGGSLATTIAANVVSDSKLRQSAAVSVIGRSANSSGNVADIAAAANGQALIRTNNTLLFGAIDLANPAAVSGILPSANIDSAQATDAEVSSAISALSSVYQPLDSDLTALAGNTGNGLWARTGTGAGSVRTIAAGTGISVSNGDGVSGNPTINASAVPNSALANSSITIQGTANQVSVSGGGPASLGATVTISAPQDIGTNSSTIFGSVTAAVKQKGPVYDITAYGADGSGTTTTVSSWTDSTHAVVADASNFSAGQTIGIARAGSVETTGNTTASSTTISSVASTNGFAVNDVIRVVNGQSAQAMVRQITVQVAGNSGELVGTRINGTNYFYTVAGGETVNTLATNLAAVITGDSSVTVTVAANVISITAAVAGTLFDYGNIRPTIGTSGALTPRTKLTYQTTAANIPQCDVIVAITAIGASSFTVSPAIPSSVTGARIEKRHNHLITTISGISGTTLTLADAATTLATGVTVTHNAQPAMVSAIAAAAAGTAGGTVYIPAGIFDLPDTSATLAFGNVNLVGAGIRKSVLRSYAWTGNGKLGWQTSANGASNVLIKDFTIDLGQPGTVYALRTGSAIQIGTTGAAGANYGTRIERVEIANTSGKGILLVNAQRAWINNCYLHDIGDSGISLQKYDNGSSKSDTPGNDIWIENNLVERSSNIGALCYNDSARQDILGTYDRLHINHNTFRHCALVGFEFYANSTDSELIGNTAEYCGAYASIYSLQNGFHGGFDIKYSTGVTASGNTAANCYNGIQVEGTLTPGTNYFRSRDIIVADNNVHDCQNNGIEITKASDNVTIQNNIVDTIAVEGIQFGGDNNQASAIAYNTRIIGNTIRAAVRGIRTGQGVSGAEIRGNWIDSCNTFETATASAAAIGLNAAGDGSFTNIGTWVIGNRMTESRTSPANGGQQYAIYALYSTFNAVLNLATGNANNTYSLGTGATLSTTLQNTWDAEGYAIGNTTGSGVVARQTSPALTAPTISGRTWSTISATTPTAGTIDYATDIGIGTHLSYVGSRWKPVNGSTTLTMLAAPVSGVANSETIELQTLIPANAWKNNDILRINMDLTKSGTTDSCLVSVRVGTAGTTADTAIVSASTFINAASRSWAGWVDLKLLSATSVQKVGGTSATSTGIGQGSGVALSPVTITSAAANALYVSVSIKSSSTADTVGIDHGSITWITP